MKRFLIYLGIFIAIIAIWYGESRKFYCQNKTRCVTVWKTFNDVCYIIPGKYYGLLKPSSENYVQTTNLSDVDIIWQRGSSDMIVSVDDNSKITTQSSEQGKFVNYNINKVYYDSVFTYFDGKYRRYNKGLDYMSIFIKESYATDKDGKHL